MEYKITEEEVAAIKKELFSLNVPVQQYNGIVSLLTKTPIKKEEKKKYS